MNLVGKIFTVFIALMSLVFASFALMVYATQTNWRLVADNDKPPEVDRKGLSQRLVKTQKDLKDSEDQKDKLKKEYNAEKDRHEKELAALKTENDGRRAGRAAAERKVAELEAGLREAVNAMQAAHQTLANLRAEADQLRKDIVLARADRDAQFKKVVGLTDDLHNAEAEKARLEKLDGDLGNQLGKARKCLQYFKLNENSDYEAQRPPVGTRGLVLKVQPPDMLEISLGADDGVRKGHTLFVVRPGGGGMKYVGKVTILVDPAPDRAVCRFDPHQLTVPIERGDLVLSELN